MHYSVLLPFTTVRPEQLLPYASMVEWSDVARLWQGQTVHTEPHQAFAHLAGTGLRVPLGIGVTLMPLRHPFEAAVHAASLARMTGRPVTMGYGPGSTGFQAMLLGAPYRSQLGAVRDYVTIVRSLLRGRTVQHDGEFYSFHGALEGNVGSRTEVGVGVLRPGMARLAGEIADTAITWLTPASYVRDTLVPAIREGAEVAGRRPPRVVSMVPLALERRGRRPAEMALASNAAHLQMPHYRDMLTRAGVRLPGGRPADDAEALVQGGAFLSGDVESLQQQLAAYAEAGVDEVVLNLTGVHARSGPAKALDELQHLLRAFGVLH